MKKNKRIKNHVILLMLPMLLLSGISSATTVDMGKQIFDQDCGFCHTGHPPTGASDAQSINALAEDAKVREASIGEIIRSGTKDGMPAFNKSDISDVEIAYIVDYLKSVPNSFDSSGTTPASQIIPISPKITPAQTTQSGQVPVTTPKAPGFEIGFVGLGVIIAYTIRKNYRL